MLWTDILIVRVRFFETQCTCNKNEILRGRTQYGNIWFVYPLEVVAVASVDTTVFDLGIEYRQLAPLRIAAGKVESVVELVV